MSWFSDMFHPDRAYKGAQQERENYYNQGQSQQQPYNQMGQQAGGNLQSMMDKLMNPGQLQNEWSQGYETSPYAQQQMNQAKTNGMDMASAMGLGGSSGALNNINNQAQGFMQTDKKNYMDEMMEKYKSAMGLGQNMFNTGAGAAGQMNNASQQMGQDSATNMYNQQSAGPNMMGNMIGGAAGMLGGMAGGPLGGMVGNYFGKKMGNQQNAWGNYY